MKQLRVTNIQRGCVYDGPGVRTTVFLKGCYLRCPWCCNPETISFEKELFIDNSKCLLSKGVHSELCKLCQRNKGSNSITACPFGVAEETSKDYLPDELFHVLLRDQALYIESNGGITFSGGEPLFQSENLVRVLVLLKEKGLHIALETSLIAPDHSLLLVSPFIDTYIVDLKIQPEMYLSDSYYQNEIKRHQMMIGGKSIFYRFVFVDSVMDYINEVKDWLSDMGINKIEILVCHNLGAKKYGKLSLANRDFTSSKEKAESFIGFLKDFGIASKILSI